MSEVCIPVIFNPNEDVTSIGFFAVVSFLVGIILSIIKVKVKWVTLPSSFMVFAAGALLGFLSVGTDLGVLDHSIANWRHLNPEILLFMFLPPLLFTSAFVVEYHIFRRLIWQALLLATVGVVITILLMAALAYGAFDYNWTLTESLLFGSVFGATDPVSVVAILGELGSPHTLSVLIEGESLLNDGVGFVLFLVFFDQLSGRETYDGVDILAKVATSSIAGAAIGIFAGMFGLVLLQQIWSDLVVAVAITVTVVWAAFFASELLQVSGVIAVVTLGLFLAAYSDGYINVAVGLGLRRFWFKVEYLANTLVFMYSGVVVVNVLLESDNTYVVTGQDTFNAVLLFVMINLIRVATVAILYVPLQYLGYGIDKARAIVLSFAGLRGAVGLIGALLILEECNCIEGEPGTHDAPCLDFEYKNRLMFFMATTVLSTLAVNGLTMKYIVKYLKLDKTSDHAKQFYIQATMNLEDHLDDVVESLKRHPHYKSADWDKVWEHIPILSLSVLRERKRLGIANRDTFIVKKDIEKVARERFVSVDDSEDAEVVQHSGNNRAISSSSKAVSEARYRFLSLVKASYRHQFAEGANTSWPTLQILIEATSRAQDHPDRIIQEWEDSIESFCNPKEFCGIPLSLTFSKAKRVGVAYEVASTFIRAHKSALGSFHRLANSMGQEVVAKILSENNTQIQFALETTEQIEREFPAIAQRVKTNITTQRVLKEMETFSYGMLERALIDEKDLHTIKEALEESRKSMQSNLKVHHQPNFKTIAKNSPLFSDISEGLLHRLFQVDNLVKLSHGEWLHAPGEKWDCVYVVIRGTGTIAFENDFKHLLNVGDKEDDNSIEDQEMCGVEYASGDVLGIVEFVSGKRYLNSVTCQTTVEALRIPYELLQRTMEDSERFEHNVMREAGLVVLSHYYPQFQFATFNLLKSVLPHARIISGHHTRHLKPFESAVRQGSVTHLLGPEGATSSSTYQDEVVEKPIVFHGGIVIGLCGTIQQVKVHNNKRKGRIPLKYHEVQVPKKTSEIPLLCPTQPSSPLMLSEDANLMHVSAEALAIIEDFTSFEEVEVDPTAFLAEMTKGKRSRIRGRHKKQHSTILEVDDVSGPERHGESFSSSHGGSVSRLSSFVSSVSNRVRRGRTISDPTNSGAIQAGETTTLHSSVNVMLGDAPDNPEI